MTSIENLVALLKGFPQSYKERKVTIGDYDPTTNSFARFHHVGRSGMDENGQFLTIPGFSPIDAADPGTTTQNNVVAFNIDFSDGINSDPKILSHQALNDAIIEVTKMLELFPSQGLKFKLYPASGASYHQRGFLHVEMLFVEHPVFHAFRAAGWLMSAI